MKQALCLLLALSFCSTGVAQHTPDTLQKDREPAIAELGAAISKNLKDGSPVYGPSIALEFTPIDEWLEIEVGFTPLVSQQPTQWSFDLLFKKPFTLSRKFEFMPGIGPELTLSKGDNPVFGAEIAADVMYWPYRTKRLGFFLEPSYDIDFAKGNNQSIGLSGGLLIPLH